jgi:hypothetical protein
VLSCLLYQPKEDVFLFHQITETDLDMIWNHQRKLHALSSEFDAFRLFAWLPLDLSEVAFRNGQFALRCRVGNGFWYLAPYETEDFCGLLQDMMAYERAAGGKTFHFLSVERCPVAFPEGFTAHPRRDLYDYLYHADDLTGFRGRAYAAKRNQVSQFKRKYDWRFEPLSPANRDACLAVVDEWDAAHPDGGLLAFERLAIERMLSFPKDYGQSGGVLFADGQPAAFAIGSHPRAELLDIVAEKALTRFTGAYATLIQAYAQYACSLAPYQFVNREEDMGMPNLREAKTQLKPACLIEKTLMTAEL